MVSKREKWLWIIYAGILVVLFLLSSTNLLMKEEKTVIYPVSVIITEENDEYYLNFKKGMELAAKEYGVDVNFITLYNKRSLNQQLELIRREYQDDARALIISPVDKTELIRFFDQNELSIPVIIIETEMAHNKVTANLVADPFVTGAALAQAVIKRYPPQVPVYIFHSGLQYHSNDRLYDGVEDVLAEFGSKTSLQKGSVESAYRDVWGQLQAEMTKEAVFIALDQETLTGLADLLEAQPKAAGQTTVISLYGVGYTQPILNAMDRGTIQGIMATNRFIEGYLSVQKAVEAISEGTADPVLSMEAVYVDAAAIRNPEYQKMLYPIE